MACIGPSRAALHLTPESKGVDGASTLAAEEEVNWCDWQ